MAEPVGAPGPAATARHPLDLLLRPAWQAVIDDGAVQSEGAGRRVVCLPGEGEPGWLDAAGWRVYARAGRPDSRAGDPIETFLREDGREARAFVEASTGDVIVPFSLAEAYHGYVSEAWRVASPNRRLSERNLELFYRVKSLIPRRVQLAARRRLIRSQGVPAFPAWPLDTSVSPGCAVLRRLHAARRRPVRG